MYQNGRFARITLTIFLIVRDCQHKLIEDPISYGYGRVYTIFW